MLEEIFWGIFLLSVGFLLGLFSNWRKTETSANQDNYTEEWFYDDYYTENCEENYCSCAVVFDEKNERLFGRI